MVGARLQSPITSESVGTEQAYLFGYRTSHEGGKRGSINGSNDACDDLTLTLHRINNRDFAD